MPLKRANDSNHELELFTLLQKYRILALVPVIVALLAACGAPSSVLSVEIAEADLRMAVSDQVQLTLEVAVTGGGSDAVSWETSNSAVATVTASGIVTAVAAGDATIRAESVANPSKSDTVTVTVLALPTMAVVPASGQALADLDGAAAAVSVTAKAGSVSLEAGSVNLLVELQSSDGTTLPYSAGGVPNVTTDGSMTITGTGYAPATPVDFWFFSDPVLLGSQMTDDLGHFEAVLPLPAGVLAGGHTLVADGQTSGGSVLSLRLGVQVIEPKDVDSALEFAHCPATTNWFVSALNGDDLALGTSHGVPFAFIQSAVDAAAAFDEVCVSAGTYALDNSGNGAGGQTVRLVSIDKPLTLVGPNRGVAGAGVRAPEAELVVSSAEADNLYAISIQASDVVIDGFAISTTTPKTDPYPDGVYGIWVSSAATQGVTARNNHLVDTNFPIWVNRGFGAAPATGFEITSNLVEGPEAASDQAIMMQAAFGVIRDNVLRDTRVGIQVQPYAQVGTGTVVDNDIEAFQAGMWFNYQQDEAAQWTFQDNRVVGVASPWGWPLYNSPDTNLWSGIRIETFQGGTVGFIGNSVEVGSANPPLGNLYLLRQRTVTDGTVTDIGTTEQLGAFFTTNTFPDFEPAGVQLQDLSTEDALIQLKVITN